ncbi:MAG: DUF6489 family protein [Pseudomonadota bacterium]|nr:DUF6489 family protein [Pseudomonadota bacterium]
MKVRIEAECTPEEARAFLGLPNVAPFNDQLVEEMTRRMQGNLNSMQPEEIWRSWMVWGGQAQEQFRNLVATATRAATGGASPGAAPGAPSGTDRER